MKILKWIDEYLEEAILIVLLICIALTMGIQIVSRYAFKSSLSWSEEITRFLFIWMGFISISYCIKKSTSIKITMLVDVFSKKAKCIFNIIAAVIQILFFGYMIPFAYRYLMVSIDSRQVSPACGVPMYFVQFSVLFGFLLSVVRLLQKIWINTKFLLQGKRR